MQKKIKTIVIISILLLILIAILTLILTQNKTIKTPQTIEETAKTQYTTQIGEKTFDITNAVTKSPMPSISAGMIPIKWNGEFWQITTKDDKEWYDYSKGQPAYIMLNDGVYQSELIQNMTGKKLAEENIGASIARPEELGSIYIWIPRFAYNDDGEILYIKQENSVAGTWIIPKTFTYETENIDFSLSGLWVEYNLLENETELKTKLANMQGEENQYGFIANVVGVAALDDLQLQTAIQTYINNLTANETDDQWSPIQNPENQNRSILKIINTNNIEPIKGKGKLNKEEGRIDVEITYTKNGISQIINGAGIILSENTLTATEEFTEETTGTYIAIDNEGNMREIEIDKLFVIPNIRRLNEFRDRINAGESFEGYTVLQVADIDMSSVCSEELGSWVPIGINEIKFAGIYDGMYHTISNLYMNTDKYRRLGMFLSPTKESIIQNLIMENIYVKNTCNEFTSSSAFGIASDSYGIIERCGIESGQIINIRTSAKTSYETSNAGGIADWTSNVIRECYNKADIYAENCNYSSAQVSAGGISGAGGYNHANIINCYNVGTVTASDSPLASTGGINATAYQVTITIENCYSIGIYSGVYKGGIFARNAGGSTIIVRDSYRTMNSGTSYGTYVDEETLKGYASNLGYTFVEDTEGINNGYPILKWELERRKKNN